MGKGREGGEAETPRTGFASVMGKAVLFLLLNLFPSFPGERAEGRKPLTGADPQDWWQLQPTTIPSLLCFLPCCYCRYYTTAAFRRESLAQESPSSSHFF